MMQTIKRNAPALTIFLCTLILTALIWTDKSAGSFGLNRLIGQEKSREAVCGTQTDMAETQSSIRQELSEKLLRFRVLANSDSADDQRQKNRVSADLASMLRPILSGCASKEEAQSKLKDALPAIEQAAQELTSRYGTDYPVSCSLSRHQFPLKIYQNLTFPAGSYDTLLITIGDGAGSNWWCLAYPPLCFAEEAYVTVPEETDEALRELLSEEAYASISASNGSPDTQENAGQPKEDGQPKGNGQQEDDQDKPAFCFRLLPFLNDWF